MSAVISSADKSSLNLEYGNAGINDPQTSVEGPKVGRTRSKAATTVGQGQTANASPCLVGALHIDSLSWSVPK